MPTAEERAVLKKEAREMLVAAQRDVNERLRLLDEGKTVAEVLAQPSPSPNRINVACDSSC